MLVTGFQQPVPEARGDAKIHAGKMVVNGVMRAQSAIPAKLKLEAVQYVMEKAVANKTQQDAGGDTQDVMHLDKLGQIPEAAERGRHHEPRHSYGSLWGLMMYQVPRVSRRPSFMIDPTVESIFHERPGSESERKGKSHQPGAAA